MRRRHLRGTGVQPLTDESESPTNGMIMGFTPTAQTAIGCPEAVERTIETANNTQPR